MSTDKKISEVVVYLQASKWPRRAPKLDTVGSRGEILQHEKIGLAWTESDSGVEQDPKGRNTRDETDTVDHKKQVTKKL